MPFFVGILVTPAVMAKSWNERLWYLLDPWMVAAICLLVAVVTYTVKSNPVRLSERDRRVANWYLLNGVFIHFLMDGMVGVFAKVPLFRTQYETVDLRYKNADPTVMAVSMVELLVMSPLSIAVFVGYHLRKPWRAPLEIVTAVLQAMGTVMFVSPELQTGCRSVPFDRDFSFTFHHILYFWFAFVVCNLLWILLPARLALTSVQQISEAMTLSGDKKEARPEAPRASKKGQ